MTKSTLRRPKRKELQEISARRQRTNNLILIAAGVAIVAIIALVIVLNIRSTLPVGAEQRLPTQGNNHIAQGSVSPVEYNSTPPTSGPHYPGLAPWAIHPTPIRYEQLIHNMEDGGVIVYYQCADGCPELVEQLSAVVRPYLNAGRHVVMVPNDPSWGEGNAVPFHKDMGARIALTAWQRIDKFDEFDADRIRAFIERYEGIDNHRPTG
ncbi:MAG: DUF3105 domain-containing protein [Caldilineaceae bacterium]|nr:DUF3105 domain-containing protein [Caldilineaceae bacterium]